MTSDTQVQKKRLNAKIVILRTIIIALSIFAIVVATIQHEQIRTITPAALLALTIYQLVTDYRADHRPKTETPAA